jgi:hypothetical protein
MQAMPTLALTVLPTVKTVFSKTVMYSVSNALLVTYHRLLLTMQALPAHNQKLPLLVLQHNLLKLTTLVLPSAKIVPNLALPAL